MTDSHSTGDRFAKYRTESDLPPWRKLEVGESFTAKLTGAHEFRTTQKNDKGQDEEVIHPVLDFDGFSWMASTWHAKEELDFANPADGDDVTVKRLPKPGTLSPVRDQHQRQARVGHPRRHAGCRQS